MLSVKSSDNLFSACVAGALGVPLLAVLLLFLLHKRVFSRDLLVTAIACAVALECACLVGILVFSFKHDAASKQAHDELVTYGKQTLAVVLGTRLGASLQDGRWGAYVSVEIHPDGAPAYRPPPKWVLILGNDPSVYFAVGETIITYVSRDDPNEFELPEVKLLSRKVPSP